MSLFGRRGEGPRTSAEREAARLERERRRALREGRPPPEPPPDDGTGAEPYDDEAPPFEWDAPPGPEPAVSRGGAAEPEREAQADGWDEPEPEDEREPEPVVGRRSEPQPATWDEPEPERDADADADAAPVAWGAPPADGRADPRAQAWQPRRPEGAEPEREYSDGADGRAAREPAAEPGAERDGEPDAAEARGRTAPDPQATQPFDPLDAGAPARRTVSLPRPQTDTSEWDAPIGMVRLSRGGGGGPGGRPYRPQPGAPGLPYRKLEVRPRRRWLRRIVVLLALALAVAAAGFAFLLFEPLHGDGHGRVTVRVPAGATAHQIGDLLAERGVVRSGFLFSLRARLSGQRAELRSGRFTLRQGMPYSAALTALTTPPKAAPVINVTVPEGPSRREEAAKIRTAGLKGDYLAATRRSSKLDPRDYGAPRSTRSLEGFLFPATYQLRAGQATASRLVSRQLDAFKAAFAKVHMREVRRKNLSRYDVLIIASMIEREALVARDRRLISAVIYNRLKEGIPLGIDATLRYALNQWSRPLRVSELESGSAYNTRRRRGLPPTPIGNPGLQAMRAAANPANVSYLFYVVKPCANGAHAFSSTDAQFQRDVARYNRARARRGGKDPSRC
jgi:UPF0755 protein